MSARAGRRTLARHGVLRALGALGVLLSVTALTAGAQGAPPPARPGQPPSVQQPQPPKRKALEIRGQAPAPEIVTVRPREVPGYTRRIIVPTLFDAPPALVPVSGGPAAAGTPALTPASATSLPSPRRTIVLLPGPPPEPSQAGPPNPTRPPE